MTYGDDERTQEETVQTVIARRPSTRAEYDKACKAIAEAEKIGNQAARLKAEAKKAEALHPEHAAWTEAEDLRTEWRELVAKGTYSEKSVRCYTMLERCRVHGQTLQEQVRQAVAVGVAKQEASGSQEEEEEVGVRIVSRPGLCAPTRPDQFDGREGTVCISGEG